MVTGGDSEIKNEIHRRTRHINSDLSLVRHISTQVHPSGTSAGRVGLLCSTVR